MSLFSSCYVFGYVMFAYKQDDGITTGHIFMKLLWRVVERAKEEHPPFWSRSESRGGCTYYFLLAIMG